MDIDKKLYKEFLNGNKNSFDKLILKHKENLLYFILKFVKKYDIAEDIFNDVIVYILSKPEYYNFEYSFKTYLYMIAKSKSINYIKNKEKEKIIENIDDIIDEDYSTEDIIINKENKNKIKSVINKMPKNYQLVMYLTKVDGLSYKEVALIMEKSEIQIKTMAFNARKKFKELLRKEKIIEIKNNRLIKMFLMLIAITTIITGVVYACVSLSRNLRTSMTPNFNRENMEYNKNMIWIGTFQIAWNELMEIYGNEPIQFVDYESVLVDELNQKSFTKDMISEEDYYVKVGKSSSQLKKEILTELEKKFGENERNLLNYKLFEENNKLILYSKIKKEFEFIESFDNLNPIYFTNNQNESKMVKCFGIDKKSDKKLYENVEVLCYEETYNDYYGIKLKTKQDEEIYIYMTKSKKNFEETFLELENNTRIYEGDRNFLEKDNLVVPNINLNFDINYSELCNREIKGTNIWISKAIQTISLNIDAMGGKIDSESLIITDSLSGSSAFSRNFIFSKPFYIFIKEKGKEKPYLAMRIENADFLEVIK